MGPYLLNVHWKLATTRHQNITRSARTTRQWEREGGGQRSVDTWSTYHLNELISICNDYDAEIDVLGCDGASVNTGVHGGIVRLFELTQQRPVHWFVCRMHSNELNLREVFKRCDGATSGPRSFTGPLGRAAADQLETRPVVAFEAVPGRTPELDDSVLEQLSNDQRLLYGLAMAVQHGSVPESLATRKIGPINHAR